MKIKIKEINAVLKLNHKMKKLKFYIALNVAEVLRK